MNYVDLAIVICLVLGGIHGFRRGLVRGVLGLLGLVLGIVLGGQLCRPLARLLEERFSAISWTAAKIAPVVPGASQTASLPLGEGEGLLDAIRGSGLPESTANQLLSLVEEVTNLPDPMTIGQAVVTLLASLIVTALCFVAILLVAGILSSFLARLIAGAVAATPFALADRLGGLVLQVGLTALILTIILGTLNLMASLPPLASLRAVLDSSSLASGFVAFFESIVPRAAGLLGPG